jgi:hypothetical protein
MNSLIDAKLTPINATLRELTGQISDALGQLKRMKIEIENRGQKGSNLLAQTDKTALPLADIRSALETAQKRDTIVAHAEFASFKDQVENLTPSAKDYWVTVAAIINYQSYINQRDNKAPDPTKVARPCSMLTEGLGKGNLIQGAPITNCVVDLDTTENELDNLVIRNSVVRYHGGAVTMKHVVFINCSFILDLKSFPQHPARPDFLRELLASDQTVVPLTSTAG